MTINFHDQLRDQLKFITRSCHYYDMGDPSEAKRIAIALRIMFQDKGRNISLLTHLKKKDAIQVLSATVPVPANGEFKANMTQIEFSPQGQFMRWIPLKEKAGLKKFVSFSEWWEGLVYQTSTHIFTRKNIILNMAEKDGGAHVDEGFTEEYTELIAGLGMALNPHPDNESSLTIQAENAHFAAVRHFAYEILNSDELLKLANPNLAPRPPKK